MRLPDDFRHKQVAQAVADSPNQRIAAIYYCLGHRNKELQHLIPRNKKKAGSSCSPAHSGQASGLQDTWIAFLDGRD